MAAEPEDDDLESPAPEPKPMLLGADDDGMLDEVTFVDEVGTLTLAIEVRSRFVLMRESFHKISKYGQEWKSAGSIK